MKKKYISIFTLFLMIFGIFYAFTGCGKDKSIARINNKELTIEDFRYDIYLAQIEGDTWNSNYKEILGIDYWDYEVEGSSMKQLTKDTVMTRVILYEVLSSEAKKHGYSLSEQELRTNEADADNFIQSVSQEQLKESGINRDILIKAFNKLTLGDKYYQAVISDYEVDEEAIKGNIDPDEYIEYITECLYVPTATVSYQQITPLSDDELEKAYHTILDVEKLIADGAGFDEVLAQVEGVIHYNRSFILSDNTAEEEYKEASIALENNSYSGVITTQFGHYIIHMLDNSSTERYEQAVENAIHEEKTSQFKAAYDELLKEYDITIDTDYWNSIEIGPVSK